LPADNWRLSAKEAPAGPMTATGIHLLDLSIGVMGAADRVFASVKTLGSQLVNGDTLGILVNFKSGGNALLGAVLATPFDGRFAVYCNKGWAEVRDKAHPEAPQGWTLTVHRRGGEKTVREFSPAKAVLANREAILLADKLGYKEALIGEHVTDLAENVTSCCMFLASLAYETKQIVLGTGTVNMPNSHPAAIAGQVAMLDHLLKGRFIFGISPGGLMSDAEAFGNYKKDRNAIFLESINMVLDIWKGEAPYNLQGQYFHVTTQNTQIPEIGQGAIIKPYQQPHPPIVVTAVAPHSKGVTEAAKRGWTPISANFLLPEWVASHWPRYEEGCKAVQKEAQPSDWRVAKSIFVADDDKVAKRYGHGPGGPYHFYFKQLIRKLVGFGGRSNLFKLDPSQPDSSITADTITPKLVPAGAVGSPVDQN